MKKLYKVGIYCRLSVDDASNSAKAKNYIPADESVSIENQYELLSKFVMLNTVKLASTHILGHYTEEISYTHSRLQYLATFKAEVCQSLINSIDNNGRCVMRIQR